jgi:SAM-dependent methyltransferase
VSHELALAEQHAFVDAAVAGAHRVLEVGAGRGDLARRLQAQGLHVTAVDLALPGRESTSGVRWVETDFLGFEDEPYDAVIFTASLHHVSPLAKAVERAWRLVVPGGLLVVDDFDHVAPDEPTARWYYEVQELLASAGLVDPGRIHGFMSTPHLERWRAEHAHEGAPLHAGRAMTREIERRFGQVTVKRGPYLYRYIVAGLSDGAVAHHVKDVEERRIADGSLRPVGLRVVARRA